MTAGERAYPWVRDYGDRYDPEVIDRGVYGFSLRWPGGAESFMPNRATAEACAAAWALAAENAEMRARIAALEKALDSAAATLAAEAMNYTDHDDSGEPIATPHGGALYDECDRIRSLLSR